MMMSMRRLPRSSKRWPRCLADRTVGPLFPYPVKMTATAVAPSNSTSADHNAKPHLRGWSHFAAFISALTLAPILIVISPGVAARFIAAEYALAIAALFGVSALLHRGDWSPRAHLLLRRLDHSMIFVAIASTYTPIALLELPRRTGLILLAVVWTGALLGIASRVAWTNAPYPVIALPYVLCGWAALAVVDDIWTSLGVAGFVLILVGGALYTLGAVIYALHRPNPWPKWFGYHEIFHLFVIAGATLHYVAIAFFVLPN